MATSGEKRWPPVGNFVATSGEKPMAIDNRNLTQQPTFVAQKRVTQVRDPDLLWQRVGNPSAAKHLPWLARIARISPTIAPPPSSKRPVLATRLDVASTRAVAAPPAVALPVSDKIG